MLGPVDWEFLQEILDSAVLTMGVFIDEVALCINSSRTKQQQQQQKRGQFLHQFFHSFSFLLLHERVVLR